jgi:hypothetical protein
MTYAVRSLLLLLTLGLGLPAAANTAAADADKQEQITELMQLHDLGTSVSIGNYYLKQESLLAIRSLLARLGREEKLGPDWNPSNPVWKRAEDQLLREVNARLASEFGNLDWLWPQWQAMSDAEFSPEELDVLLTHFRTDVGRKQLKIVDHTISTHVITTLSFSGKLHNVPGVEADRNTMQQVWNKEDEEMRFSIQDAANYEGTRFALSPLGKKYFVNSILKVTGIVNRRIEALAAALPQEVNARADEVRPLLEEYRNSRG